MYLISIKLYKITYQVAKKPIDAGGITLEKKFTSSQKMLKFLQHISNI